MKTSIKCPPGRPGHLFIINPMAGKKNQTEALRAAIARLELPDAKVEVTEYPGHATLLAGAFAENCDGFARIYSCGGDGTFSEVVRGVYKLDHAAVGVVPIGSGNDFVRTLTGGREFDLSQLADYVCGNIGEVDLLKCSGESRSESRIAANSASAGFDCTVCINFNKIKKLPLVKGSLAYNLSIFRTLFGGLKHEMSIYADGEFVSNPGLKYLLAAGGNGRFYGGGIEAFPLAKQSDGYIELVMCEAVSLPTFAKFIGTFSKGKHILSSGEVAPEIPFIKYLRCKSFQIKAESDVDICLDGEVFSIKNPLVEVVPGGLKVIMPGNKNA